MLTGKKTVNTVNSNFYHLLRKQKVMQVKHIHVCKYNSTYLSWAENQDFLSEQPAVIPQVDPAETDVCAWSLLSLVSTSACVNEQFRGFSLGGWVIQGRCGWCERGCHLVQIPVPFKQALSRTYRLCLVNSSYNLWPCLARKPPNKQTNKKSAAVIVLLTAINNTHNYVTGKVA